MKHCRWIVVGQVNPDHPCTDYEQMMNIKKTPQEKFNGKFSVSGNCWNWTGAKKKDGYGYVKLDGKDRLAHRLSYQLFKGEIPDEKCVCHTCDNRLCVNPDHLWLGTPAENDLDKLSKGRQAKGEKMWLSKLKPADIIDIRENCLRYSRGQSSTSHFAKKYGVSPSNICSILRRETWFHV